MEEYCCGQLRDSNASVKTRMTYWYILDSFAKAGQAPTVDEIERDLLIPRDQILSILDSLVAEGKLRVAPASSMILDVYPYSGVSTRHRVYLDNGMILYCMCAVDTFYVPFLIGCDLTIRSHCLYCRSEIEIIMEGHKICGANSPHSVV